MTHLLLALAYFVVGIVALLAFIFYRMMRSDGWDKSNVTNAARLLIHVVLHPEDFGQMYYLLPHQVELLQDDLMEDQNLLRPFWYIDKDELSEVVETRP